MPGIRAPPECCAADDRAEFHSPMGVTRMSPSRRTGRGRILMLFVAGVFVAGSLSGCAGGSSGELWSLFGTGSPFRGSTGATTGVTGPGETVSEPGGDISAGSGAFTDPCDESQNRKFVRISMRNLSLDYIHYFLVLIAEVNSDTYPNGAVCPDDIALYTSFGYVSIPTGSEREFGNYCIEGPALFYFHDGGQFRGAGAQGLASAIAPAEGSQASYDSFFNTSGAQVPVPNYILFHNPGTTSSGRTLKVSINSNAPCAAEVVDLATPNCEQDAWYYVDENDIRAGTTTLGPGAFVRVPSEIQGTGCECGLSNEGWSRLAPSTSSAGDAACDEFFRGGRIEYVFIRDDTEPPFPQLVWRVTDDGGVRAQDFDPRANVN
jgi:hypothetical protein